MAFRILVATDDFYASIFSKRSLNVTVFVFGLLTTNEGARVKIRPRKACNYLNLRPSGWVLYDKVGVLYLGKVGNRSEVRAADLKSYAELWWNRIKLRLYEGK